jgi:YbbR domain-containing protein
MLASLRKLARLVPALFTAFILALAVWISAVTSNDPLEQRAFPTEVPIEIIGQASDLVMRGNAPGTISIILSAPRSIWDQLTGNPGSVRAILDLSGKGAGTYTLPVQLQIVPRPVRKVSQTPTMVTVTLENLATKEISIHLVQRGTPATGYMADTPTLNRGTVIVSGPQSLVERVAEVRAVIDISQASQTINRTVSLTALDANELTVNNVKLMPEQVTVNQAITQRFGYRNVVVKVDYTGQVAAGYRLTNISVFPPAVTVFSSNPQIVSDLPGYIETQPLDLNGVNDDLDISLGLNLPEGVSVVGEQTEVLVRVGIAAIESSLMLPNVTVEITGLSPGFRAVISPETVMVILSGPVALLDRLEITDVRVVVDLTDLGVGTYQLEPEVEYLLTDLAVESILPESVEITIMRGGTSSP